MESKKLDINRSVHDLCKDYPDLPEILAELGFKDILIPGMLATAGRFMTLKKGAEMKKISLYNVKEILTKNGYEIIE